MTDSNPQFKEFSQKPQSPRNYQYTTDYQTNSYAPPKTAVSGLPFAQSQTGGSGLYTVNNQPSSYYSSNIGHTVNSGSRVRTQTNNLISSQVKNQEVVKGQSRINYVPYQKKVIEYEDRQYIQKVPIKKKKTRMEQRRVTETVPKEVTKTQYYAVEKRVEYQKQIIPQKRIEMVKVEKKIKRYQYVPVQKQIVHYPQNVDLQTAKSQSRIVLRDQGINVQGDAQFKPINPTLIYNYSDRPQSRNNNIGYVELGHSRVLSTAPTPHDNYQTYQQYAPPPQDYQNTYNTQTVYSTGGGNNFSSSNVYSYSPFQNMQGSQRPAQFQQSSPQVVVTDPRGDANQQLAPRSRGSYITELNTFGSKAQASRPFQNINAKSRNRPGITQVKRNSENKNSDYKEEYSQNQVEGERNYDQNYNSYESSNADWRIQK